MYIDTRIQPFVNAMRGASGLSEFNAITSVFYAIATHIDLPHYPILIYYGARGTGKSEAMKQLFPMCRGSEWVNANTEAGHRNALRKGIMTAFVDEADHIDNNAGITMLYTRRFNRQTAFVEVNEQEKHEWKLNRYDIFGATVMAKRSPIADVALRSRAIVVRTTYGLDTSYKQLKTGDVSRLAAICAAPITSRLRTSGEIDRVQQTWGVLNEIATEFRMTEWLKEAENVQAREAETFGVGQDYEPSDAILRSVDILARDINNDRVNKIIHTSEIVTKVKEEFALSLKPNQIREELIGKGFEIGILHGYPIVKVKKELLDKLLPE